MPISLAANALTTVADAATELGISAITYADILTRRINAASAVAERYCNRSFYHVSDEEVLVPGTESPYLFLHRTPVEEVASIEYDGADIGTGGWFLEDADAGTVYNRSGTWLRSVPTFRSVSDVPVLGMEPRLYTVTCTGGYYTPSQVSGQIVRTLPWDIEEAVLQIVVHLYRTQGRNTAVIQESSLKASQMFAQPFADRGWLESQVPAAAQILKMYRRLAV